MHKFLGVLFLLTFSQFIPHSVSALDFNYNLAWTCSFQDVKGAKVMRGSLPLTRCNTPNTPTQYYQVGPSCSGSFDKVVDGLHLYVSGSLTPVGTDSFEVRNFMTAVYRESDSTLSQNPDLLASMMNGVQVRIGQRFDSAAVYYHQEGQNMLMTHGACAYQFVTIVPLPKKTGAPSPQ